MAIPAQKVLSALGHKSPSGPRDERLKTDLDV
jgi:hypothetical protein